LNEARRARPAYCQARVGRHGGDPLPLGTLAPCHFPGCCPSSLGRLIASGHNRLRFPSQEHHVQRHTQKVAQDDEQAVEKDSVERPAGSDDLRGDVQGAAEGPEEVAQHSPHGPDDVELQHRELRLARSVQEEVPGKPDGKNDGVEDESRVYREAAIERVPDCVLSGGRQAEPDGQGREDGQPARVDVEATSSEKADCEDQAQRQRDAGSDQVDRDDVPVVGEEGARERSCLDRDASPHGLARGLPSIYELVGEVVVILRLMGGYFEGVNRRLTQKRRKSKSRERTSG